MPVARTRENKGAIPEETAPLFFLKSFTLLKPLLWPGP